MANKLYVGTEEGVITIGSHEGMWGIESQSLKTWGIEEVVVDPNAGNRVYAGTRGDGVLASEDGGKSWKKPSYGRPGPGKVRCLTIDPHDSHRLYAGCEPVEIFVSEDQGANWERLDSLRQQPYIAGLDYPVPSVEPHVRDVTIDPNDANTIYAALQVGYMVKSTDGGKTWKRLENELDPDVHTIVVNASQSNTVVVATGGGGSRQGLAKGRALYLSEDGGEQWTPVGMEFSQHYSVPLVAHPTNPSMLWASLAGGTPNTWRGTDGANSMLIRTTDGGHSWHRLDDQLPEASNYFPIAITVDQNDPNQLYIGLGPHIASSNDGGASWSTLDLEFPEINFISCATI